MTSSLYQYRDVYVYRADIEILNASSVEYIRYYGAPYNNIMVSLSP